MVKRFFTQAVLLTSILAASAAAPEDYGDYFASFG